MVNTKNLERPKIISKIPGPKAEKFIQRGTKCFTLCLPRFFPNLIVMKGKGAFIEDVDGNAFMDLGTTSSPVGHNHPLVVKAIKEQGEKLLHFYGGKGLNVPYLELAEKIKEISSGKFQNRKIVFCCSGSEAIEFSIKLARYITRKSVILTFLGAHHGRSLGVMAFTSDFSSAKRYSSPSVIETIYVPYPNCYRCTFGGQEEECSLACLNFIKEILDTAVPPESVAAILLEPMQSWNGFIVPPAGYLRKISELCKKNNILLIVDEVQTGMGRSGKMLCIEHWDIEADIICLGKAFGGEMPLAAMIAKKEMVDAWETGARGGMASSFAGNPLACVASLATIEIIKRNNLLQRVEELSKPLAEWMAELKSRHPIVGDWRGKGLLLGIEVVKGEHPEKKIPAREEATKVINYCFKKGLILDHAGTYQQVIRMFPPLIIARKVLGVAFEILDEALEEVEDSSS